MPDRSERVDEQPLSLAGPPCLGLRSAALVPDESSGHVIVSVTFAGVHEYEPTLGPC